MRKRKATPPILNTCTEREQTTMSRKDREQSTLSATEYRIIRLEKKHPDILFLDSEAEGLYYASCAGDKRLALIGTGGIVILNQKQAYALSKELMDVFNTYSNRGNRRTKAKSALENKREEEEYEQFAN